jgi:ribosome biogenesis protein Nip4
MYSDYTETESFTSGYCCLEVTDDTIDDRSGAVVREKTVRLATNVARKNLISLGTCFGKFSKSGKFRLHVTALDYLAPYSKVRVLCLDGKIEVS